MLPAHSKDFEKIIAFVALAASITCMVVRWVWERASKTSPDPWPYEIDRAVKAKDAIPVCVNCLYPQIDRDWFCPHCGFPTGDYVAVMPYLQIFVVGEALRKGVIGPPERRIGVQAFLIVFAVAEYAFFAPVYWFWMLRRALGRPICVERREPIEVEENA